MVFFVTRKWSCLRFPFYRLLSREYALQNRIVTSNPPSCLPAVRVGSWRLLAFLPFYDLRSLSEEVNSLDNSAPTVFRVSRGSRSIFVLVHLEASRPRETVMRAWGGPLEIRGFIGEK